MFRRFCDITVELIVAGWLLAGFLNGEASAQCYPGLACPASSDPGPAPQPLTPQDAFPPPHEVTTVRPGTNRSFWTHNGSLVYLIAEGASRSFFYETPRPAIRAAGADRGTLLFRGRKQGSSYSGTAYVFAGRCGAVPYEVRGSVSDEDKRVTLGGDAPSGISRDCQVTGYRRDILVFDFSR